MHEICISQGTVVTFFICGEQEQNYLWNFFRIVYTKKLFMIFDLILFEKYKVGIYLV